MPGMGIAVAAAGRVVWRRSFGVTNIQTNDPVTGYTLFEAASMTKPAFAYVVMKMVDQRRIGLDHHLVDYFDQRISAPIQRSTGSPFATCFGTAAACLTGRTDRSPRCQRPERLIPIPAKVSCGFS